MLPKPSPRSPPLIPLRCLFNSFLKVTDKFDVAIDSTALKQVTEYRAALAYKYSRAGGFDMQVNDVSNLHTNPYPPSAKIMPLNVRELEFQLNQNSKHSTFHTDCKIIKEIEVGGDGDTKLFKHEITQDEKLAYKAH